MLQEEILLSLKKYVLPIEMVEYFDLVKIGESEEVLHLYLDESDHKPEEYKDFELFPNGFYEEALIKDFPLHHSLPLFI